MRKSASKFYKNFKYFLRFIAVFCSRFWALNLAKTVEITSIVLFSSPSVTSLDLDFHYSQSLDVKRFSEVMSTSYKLFFNFTYTYTYTYMYSFFNFSLLLYK